MKQFIKMTLMAAFGMSFAFGALSYADNKPIAENKAPIAKPQNKAAAIKLASNATSDKKNTTPMSAAVSSAERSKIEGVVHDYLIQNPEIIVEALQIMQRKQYEQAEQTIQNTQKIAPKYVQALFHQANDPFVGNANGTVTIVEFFDYQCPHCVDMAPTLEAIVKANSDVRVVYKEFPIRGPISDKAARAALAANKQGKYYELHHAMLTAKPPLTEDAIYEFAKNIGLNVDQLKKDMNDKSVDEQLKSNVQLAQDLKLFGTPAFFIGKTDTKNAIDYVPGQMNQDQMQQAIDKTKA